MACFLDVAKAYGSVPYELLFCRMRSIDMPPTWIDLLERLYSINTVVATFGPASTEPVAVRQGLKQGWPLSPLLYMLYTVGLEHH